MQHYNFLMMTSFIPKKARLDHDNASDWQNPCSVTDVQLNDVDDGLSSCHSCPGSQEHVKDTESDLVNCSTLTVDDVTPTPGVLAVTENNEKPLPIQVDNSGNECQKSVLKDDSKFILSDSCYLPQSIPVANGPTIPEFREFDELILSFMKEHSVPGISLAISKKGTLKYTQTYGFATHGIPLQAHHLFRIASVTKIITAIAVLRLYEDKKLKLGDKVFGSKGILPQYVPTTTGDRRLLRITVRHLLSNSAGWDREAVGDPVFWKHVGHEMGVPEPVSCDVLIRYMMSQKLQFTPGSKYSYSNLGYLVLGRVIEQCSGDTYEHYVQSLLKEIGIMRMQLGRTFRDDAHPDEVEYFASAQYRCVESIFPGIGNVPAPYGSFAMETGDADGGWIACPSDLVKIMESLEGIGGKRLLKPETFKLMLERPAYAKGSCWYGLGLEVSWYRKAWEHGGHLDGATSCLTRNKNGITWAILCNFWPTDTDYTSLVSYGLTKIKGWTRIKNVAVDYATVATLDRKHCINLKLRECDFPKHYHHFHTQGFRVSWFDAYRVADDVFVNVIWLKDGKNGLCFHGVLPEALQTTIAGAKQQGYSPIHIDAYFSCSPLGGTKSGQHVPSFILRFAVVFLEGDDSTIVEHNLPVTSLMTRTEALKEQGYFIKCQCPYSVGDNHYVAALWAKSTSSGCWPKLRIPLDRYQGEFDRQARYGHLPSYLKSYTEDKACYLSVIFSHPGPFLYTAEHDMSKYRVINDVLFVAQKKFYPLCICGYEVEHGHKFAVVCVKQVPAKK